MRYTAVLATCAVGILSAASGALAGGFAAPVVEPAVAAPVVETARDDWTGPYVGGSLGYSFGADDEVGLDFYDGDSLIERNPGLGSVDVKGVTAGVHAGYRWQRDNWVFGPEVWLEGGSVDAADDVSLDGLTVESSVNYIIGLHLKTGYAVDPRTLVYGTVGAVHGDFDYEMSDAGGTTTEGYSAGGYSVGLGVERKVRPNLAVFAEWQYRNFGKTDLTFDNTTAEVLTRATPEHHNIKAGVNFSF